MVFSPYDPNQIDKSKFVIIRSKEENDEYLKKRSEQSRLVINCKKINTDSLIAEVIERINVHPKFQHLCSLPSIGVTWASIIDKYCN